MWQSDESSTIMQKVSVDQSQGSTIMWNEEQTFVKITSDDNQPLKLGEIISRFENKGLNMVEMRLLKEEIMPGHPQAIQVMVWKGNDAVQNVLKLIGNNEPGSITKDFCNGKPIVEGATSIENAEESIKKYFPALQKDVPASSKVD